jgi:hypothetical protein
LPPYSGGLRCYHLLRSFGPRLPTQEGSGAATYPMASDPASLFRRAPTLPRVPQLWTLPPCLGGLRCHHVFCGFGPYLLAQEGCHVFHDSQRATCLRNKKRSSWPRHVARLTCFQGTLVRYRGAYKMCGQPASS